MIGNPTLGDNLQGMSGVGFFNSLLSTLVTIFLIVGGIIFLFMLISGAISWITSGGDKQKTENARQRISHALVGIVILFAVFAIVNLAESIFGVDILRININPLILG